MQKKLHELALSLLQRLRDAGYVTYFAGGCVRDRLLGRECKEIDIATAAPPEEILALFPKTIAVGAQFGVIVVVLEGHSFEVATFRHDGGYVDGRHPDRVTFCSAEEDAKRRDFTINGLFYDPIEERLYDFVSGQEDLHKKIVRAIGSPEERFAEDRLRMLRAVRFATHLNFTLEARTAQAIASLAPSLLPSVSMERVWQELSKMALGPCPATAFALLHSLGLLAVIFPPLASLSSEGLRQRTAPYAHYPPATPPIFYLHALVPEMGLSLCTYLKTSTHERTLLETLHALPTTADRTTWAHYYAHPDAWICLHIAHGVNLEEHIARYRSLAPHIERLVSRTPLVTAPMLQSHGIPPGPQLGALLRRAEYLAIEHDLSDPQALLSLLFPT